MFIDMYMYIPSDVHLFAIDCLATKGFIGKLQTTCKCSYDMGVRDCGVG